MFHSNNSSDSSCNNNVIPFTSISDDYPSSPFSNNDVNPNNTLFKPTHYPSLPFDHYPYSSFFHFSPTFNIIDDHHHEDHHEFLFSHQFLTTLDTILPMEVTLDHHQMPIPDKDTTTVTVNNNNNNKEIKSSGEKCCNNSAGDKINWVDTKRCLTSKKDRHSKIVTAQGPRDRRMRLSLKVAKPFFTLQDMLGFDKASKTVEWLMINSKEAIKELARSRRGDGGGWKSVDSSISESCEVVSEVDICNPSAVTTDQDHDQQVGNNNTSSVHKKEKRVTRPSRKPMFLPQAKESREKARARARERTIGKIWSRSIPLMQQYTQGNHFNDNQNLLNPFSSPYGFETGDESGSRSQEVKSSLEVVADFEELSSHSLEESMMNTSNSSASKIFNYQQEIKTSQGLNLNNNHNFPENWDINESTENSSFCATSPNIRLSTGNTHNPITTSPFCLTTSTARFPSQFADFQFFDKPLQTYYSQSP